MNLKLWTIIIDLMKNRAFSDCPGYSPRPWCTVPLKTEKTDETKLDTVVEDKPEMQVVDEPNQKVHYV